MGAEGKVKFWFTESLYIFWNNTTWLVPLNILNKSPPRPTEWVWLMSDSVVRMIKPP